MIDDQGPKIKPTRRRGLPRSNPAQRPSSTGPVNGHLLRWLADRMRGDERFRKHLPRFETLADRQLYSLMLREILYDCWTEDTLDDFLQDRDARNIARPQFSLPWSPTTSALPTSDHFAVRLVPSRAGLHEGPETVVLRADKRQWTFNLAASPLLKALIGGDPRSFEDLCSLVHTLSIPAVRSLLADLCRMGLIAIC
jgi:hypothetical protein